MKTLICTSEKLSAHQIGKTQVIRTGYIRIKLLEFKNKERVLKAKGKVTPCTRDSH